MRKQKKDSEKKDAQLLYNHKIKQVNSQLVSPSHRPNQVVLFPNKFDFKQKRQVAMEAIEQRVSALRERKARRKTE
jgi:hypothetical protein